MFLERAVIEDSRIDWLDLEDSTQTKVVIDNATVDAHDSGWRGTAEVSVLYDRLAFKGSVDFDLSGDLGSMQLELIGTMDPEFDLWFSGNGLRPVGGVLSCRHHRERPDSESTGAI